MKKLFILTLFASFLSFASHALTPITGPTGVCAGSVITLADSLSPGGTWSSSNTSVATIVGIPPHYGDVTGITPGTATITYSLSGVDVYTVITVDPIPAAISGSVPFCVSSTITLADATPGGTWVSYGGYYATVGSTSGVVTGVNGGYELIGYEMPGGCSAVTTVTITTTFVDTITGPYVVCPGSSITLSDALPGGTWSSSNTTLATVTSGGVVMGLSSGYVTISYTVSGSCGLGSATQMVFVDYPTVSVSPISGPGSVYTGAPNYYSSYPYGGTWSSSNPGVGTIDATTGTFTGISTGTTTISYGVSGCSGIVYATQVVSVAPFGGISGNVLFTGVPYYGPLTVYLITYDPTTHILAAIDSVVSYVYGSPSSYYEFSGMPTDSFRIKAAGYDTLSSFTGYMPTYHTSSFYWHAANVVYHTSGIADLNKDITMTYGVVPAGPGFIGGSVYSGANKGTAGEAPVKGMRMFLVNSTTGTMMQQTKTDASGNYTFINIPLGTYYVHPEADGYLTTRYDGITLTSSTTSVTSAKFIQHTLSHTITPVTVAVGSPKTEIASVIVFPNPSNGNINLLWNETVTEKGNVSISDITGREVYNTNITMTQGTGSKQIDLSNLASGTYMISVNSESINYNSKIQIAH
ncbi:MAG: C-terminal target protein [Flavipsychrobacter sp.]|nr:C-terminal target protein [Flavipsychrobacter sp.]